MTDFTNESGIVVPNCKMLPNNSSIYRSRDEQTLIKTNSSPSIHEGDGRVAYTPKMDYILQVRTTNFSLICKKKKNLFHRETNAK